MVQRVFADWAESLLKTLEVTDHRKFPGMHRQRVFHRLTRRGKVLKVVREHYLRDDIGCGSASCELCAQLSWASETTESAQLSVGPYRHQYIVLDTNAVLHQMDVLEYDCPALRDIIILQTVAEEVRGAVWQLCVATMHAACAHGHECACCRFATEILPFTIVCSHCCVTTAAACFCSPMSTTRRHTQRIDLASRLMTAATAPFDAHARGTKCT